MALSLGIDLTSRGFAYALVDIDLCEVVAHGAVPHPPQGGAGLITPEDLQAGLQTCLDEVAERAAERAGSSAGARRRTERAAHAVVCVATCADPRSVAIICDDKLTAPVVLGADQRAHAEAIALLEMTGRDSWAWEPTADDLASKALWSLRRLESNGRPTIVLPAKDVLAWLLTGGSEGGSFATDADTAASSAAFDKSAAAWRERPLGQTHPGARFPPVKKATDTHDASQNQDVFRTVAVGTTRAHALSIAADLQPDEHLIDVHLDASSTATDAELALAVGYEETALRSTDRSLALQALAHYGACLCDGEQIAAAVRHASWLDVVVEAAMTEPTGARGVVASLADGHLSINAPLGSPKTAVSRAMLEAVAAHITSDVGDAVAIRWTGPSSIPRRELAQLVADVAGVPVRLCVGATAAVGAALIAATAHGAFESVEEARQSLTLPAKTLAPRPA